jgi:hypothetical protein
MAGHGLGWGQLQGSRMCRYVKLYENNQDYIELEIRRACISLSPFNVMVLLEDG